MKYIRLLAIILTVLSASAVAASPGKSKAAVWSDHITDMSEQWGIKILGIRTTAAGYMLDFRYRVTDAEKAAPIFKRRNKPVLVDQRSKQKFFIASSPTVGPMRSSDTPLVGRTYFMLFGNPGGYIRPGDKISIEVGPFKVKNLTVQ